MTSRGRIKLQRTLCFVGAFVAVALGVTSFDLVLLVVGVLVAIVLVLLAAWVTPRPTARGPE